MLLPLLAVAAILAAAFPARAQEEEPPERPAVESPAPAVSQKPVPVALPPMNESVPEPKIDIEDPAPAPPPPPPSVRPKSGLKIVPPVPPPPPAPPEVPSAPSAAEEFSFLVQSAGDESSEASEALVPEVESFLARNPDGPQAPAARFLLATVRARKGDSEAAVLDWLLFLHEHPASPQSETARKNFVDLVDKKMSRKLRGPLKELGLPGVQGSAAARVAGILERLTELAAEDFYEPLDAGLRRFMARFPDYPGTDRIQWTLGQVAEKKEKYPAAILAYQKLLALYPAGSRRAAAQWAMAEILADHLKEHNRAVVAFMELVEKYPKDSNVLPALENAAKLLEERLKSYGSAVEAHERIITLFPKSEGSWNAFQNKARIQRDKLSKPEEAIATYKRVPGQFRYPVALEALRGAAVIARKDLKDYRQEAELRSKAAADYPDAKEAPEELFSAAEIYEEDLKDLPLAEETYKAVAGQYPTHKLAKKVQDRLARIEKKKGQR